MLEFYSHGNGYYRALYQTFKAKKRAEVAPGVGGYTELFYVTRDGASAVDRSVIDRLEEIHKEDIRRVDLRSTEIDEELSNYFNELYSQPPRSK